MQKTQSSSTPTLQPRDSFQSVFGRFFGDALQEFYGTPDTTQPAPRIDVSETDQGYELAFELPGLEEKDIHVHLQDHVLTLNAERRENREAKGRRWHRTEHRFGQFSRTISLPRDAASTGVQAVYKHGVLTVTVPKTPESQPTKIEVRGN